MHPECHRFCEWRTFLQHHQASSSGFFIRLHSCGRPLANLGAAALELSPRICFHLGYLRGSNCCHLKSFLWRSLLWSFIFISRGAGRPRADSSQVPNSSLSELFANSLTSAATHLVIRLVETELIVSIKFCNWKQDSVKRSFCITALLSGCRPAFFLLLISHSSQSVMQQVTQPPGTQIISSADVIVHVASQQKCSMNVSLPKDLHY